MNDLETVELYSGELWECQFYSTILEDNGIEHFTKNSTYSIMVLLQHQPKWL